MNYIVMLMTGQITGIHLVPSSKQRVLDIIHAEFRHFIPPVNGDKYE